MASSSFPSPTPPPRRKRQKNNRPQIILNIPQQNNFFYNNKNNSNHNNIDSSSGNNSPVSMATRNDPEGAASAPLVDGKHVVDLIVTESADDKPQSQNPDKPLHGSNPEQPGSPSPDPAQPQPSPALGRMLSLSLPASSANPLQRPRSAEIQRRESDAGANPTGEEATVIILENKFNHFNLHKSHII